MVTGMTFSIMVERLLAALKAGELAGGDSRGKQCAAVKVASPGSGFMGSDVVFDLNIYDHVEPVTELSRVTDILLKHVKQES